MFTSEMVLLILRLMAGPNTRALQHRAEVAAPLILHAVRATKLEKHRVIFAAVLMKESSFRPDVVGKAGEIGYSQIKPGRFASKVCPGLDLQNPAQNVLCGARYLFRAIQICGDDPRQFLRLYNGQMCGPSEYAEKVLKLAARAETSILADISP